MALANRSVTVMLAQLKKLVRGNLNRYARTTFLDSCIPKARLLDVGCGNGSPKFIKSIRPDIHYVGLDVGDYNQSEDPRKYAKEYIIVPPEQFAAKILEMRQSFDVVISAHNIEHCNDPTAVLTAMARALAAGGRIFLSFPCEASIHFPRRHGTLNFFDDWTHQILPKFDQVLSILQDEGCVIDVAKRRYRPLYHCVRGVVAEPFSMARKKVMYGTWALYGFESIVWATARPAGTAA
jgi:SAM-dependent methyltransferase